MTRTTQISYAVLVACTLAHFMHHVYTGALSPFLSIIREELSLSLTEVGVVASAAVITMTFSHMVVGYLSDRGWRDIFIPLSILMTALVVLTMSLATTFVFLAATQLMLGIGASTYHPCAFPALADHFPKSHRAKATGVQGMGGLLGSATIPIAGVILLTQLGTWQNSLVLLGATGVILFVPALMLMRGSSTTCYWKDNGDAEPDGESGWTVGFALLVVLAGLRGMPFRCLTLLMPLYLTESHSLDVAMAGVLTSMMLATGLLAEVISGPLSDRAQRRVPFLVMSSGMMVPGLLLLNLELDLVALVLVLAFIGFWFYWGDPPGMALETELSPKRGKGIAFGLIFSLGALPGAVAPAIFGLIGDNYGLEASILFLVVVTGLSALVAAMVRERRTAVTDPVAVQVGSHTS